MVSGVIYLKLGSLIWFKVYSLIKGYWSLWVRALGSPGGSGLRSIGFGLLGGSWVVICSYKWSYKSPNMGYKYGYPT